jgi:hypothetical protein
MLPLQHLLEINLREACTLRLLSLTSSELESVLPDVRAAWASPADELIGFKRALGVTADKCLDAVAWMERRAPDRYVIHRVGAISTLKYALAGTLDPLGATLAPIASALDRALLDVETLDRGVASAAERDGLEHRLRLICEEVRERIAFLPPSHAPAKVRADALHRKNSQTWIAFTQQDDPSMLSCQQLRDMLGLIHYPDRDKRESLSQLLLHISFEIQISSTPLPARYDPAFIVANPTGMWLVRPTVCDGPNERFVQRHSSDPLGGTADYGRTINISDETYAEGFPELILVHGEYAELTWRDLRLLPAIPQLRASDSNHEIFVNVIATRLGHTTA